MRYFAVILFTLSACSWGFTQAPVSPNIEFPPKPVHLPFRLANNLVLLEVRVNGSEPGWFIFDTGAESTVLDAGLTKMFGIRQLGKTVANGAAGSATAGIVKGITLEFSGIKLTNLTGYTLPLASFGPTFGVKISGIIGNDIIAKMIAEIDYLSYTLTLYQPDAFVPDAKAEVLPLTISGNLPFVQVQIAPYGRKSISAKMEIDTGSSGSVLFNGPFVRNHRLISSLVAKMASKTGGVGGTGTSIVGRIANLRFGKSQLSEPIAILYKGTKGDNASSDYGGLLGGAIFRRFKLTIDMSGRRLFLQPNIRLAEPFETDMSGMDLLADKNELKSILINEVKPQSAAARSNIRGGDVLTSVNGRNASDLGIQEVRHLMRVAGEYDLILTRGSRVITCHLSLKRVV